MNEADTLSSVLIYLFIYFFLCVDFRFFYPLGEGHFSDNFKPSIFLFIMSDLNHSKWKTTMYMHVKNNKLCFFLSDAKNSCLILYKTALVKSSAKVEGILSFLSIVNAFVFKISIFLHYRT